jgi:hypothetical protein
MQTGRSIFARTLFSIAINRLRVASFFVFPPAGFDQSLCSPAPAPTADFPTRFRPHENRGACFRLQAFFQCGQTVTRTELGGVFARRLRPLPVFARVLIRPRTKPQPSPWLRREKARFSAAFPGGRGWGSRACSCHPCVPPVYLANTSCRRRAKTKRSNDRLCTASVLSVNQRTGRP